MPDRDRRAPLHYVAEVQERDFSAREEGFTLRVPPAGGGRGLFGRRDHHHPGRVILCNRPEPLDGRGPILSSPAPSPDPWRSGSGLVLVSPSLTPPGRKRPSHAWRHPPPLFAATSHLTNSVSPTRTGNYAKNRPAQKPTSSGVGIQSEHRLALHLAAHSGLVRSFTLGDSIRDNRHTRCR